MTQNVLIISASQYRITNDSTGAVDAEGCTVRYLMTEDLQHTEDSTRAVKGYVPAKANLPYNDFAKFQTVPGLYEAELSYSVDSKGKAAITPIGFKLLNGVSITKGGGAKTAAVTGFPTK